MARLCTFLLLLALGVQAQLITSSRRITWDPGAREWYPTTRTTICTTLSPSLDGDDADDIESALNSCPAGQVVKLNAGTFEINTSIQWPKSGVTLRGSGQGSTILQSKSTKSGNPFFDFYNGHGTPPDYDWANHQRTLSSSISKGDTAANTTTAHNLSVDDYVLIDQDNDESGTPPWDEVGYGGTCTWCSRTNGATGGERVNGQVVQVTSITDSDTFEFTPAAYTDYLTTQDGEICKASGHLEDISIESLTIDNTADPSTIYTFWSYGLYNSIFYDLDINGIGNGGGSAHFKMWNGLWITVKQCTLRNALGYSTNNGYGAFLGYGTSAWLFEDNVCKEMVLCWATEGASAGHVVAYNYAYDSVWSDTDTNRLPIMGHAAGSNQILIEGNVVEGRFRADHYFGAQHAWTLHRNRIYQDLKLYQPWTIDIEADSGHYSNFVGNVLGTNGWETVYECENDDGCGYSSPRTIYRLGYEDILDTDAAGNDSVVKSTQFRHRNYDYVTDGEKDCADTGEPGAQGGDCESNDTIPDSYYLGAKPSFFGSCVWPAVGPDLSPMTDFNPAYYREETGSCTTEATGPSISSITDNRADYDGSNIPQYAKLEISFDVTTAATSTLFPYDASPPSGIDPTTYQLYDGVTVTGEFSPDNWTTTYEVPGFYYEGFQEDVKGGSDWYLRDDTLDEWKVRFAPTATGSWKYRLKATDSEGSVTSAESSFTVVSSTNKGFIRVSSTDPRYFEYSNGDVFLGLGYARPENPELLLSDPEVDWGAEYPTLNTNGINLLRMWFMSYGSAWLDWRGDSDAYGGYVPRAGLEGYQDQSAEEFLTVRLMEADSWYDPCRMFKQADTPAVEQSTNYKFEVEYELASVTGPRVGGSYGLVLKHDSAFNSACEDSGQGTVISSYVTAATSDWATLSGTWSSGTNDFAPHFAVALENVNTGSAWIRNISLKEDLGGGSYGPELFRNASQQYETYVPHEQMFAMDKVVELAEDNDIYLKVVLTEKGEYVWYKINDDGSFVIGAESDNEDGVYGQGRTLNKTRWLQAAWWRYAQARWGYSTAIHSWELMNEGDPAEVKHFQAADEFSKELQCRVFGQTIAYTDSQTCSYEHPNRHLTTTSFWSGWPGTFWGSSTYPNPDYADFHAYIFSSPASSGEKALMEDDAAYQHLWHADYADDQAPGIPIIRGETGMDTAAAQQQQADIQNDTTGVWYHNLLWAQLGPDVMHDLYWWQEDIYNDPTFDHRDEAGNLRTFLQAVPLANGRYVDAAATGPSGLRIVGQKDLLANRAHLWIQNDSHTWRAVVDADPITPITGTVSITMNASKPYRIVYWDTYTGTISGTATASSAESGVLSVPVTSLSTDTAVHIEQEEVATNPLLILDD